MSQLPINILIVDDHFMVLEGLRSLLADQDDIRIQGACAVGEDALKLIAQQTIHVVLMDINLPDIHGTELCRQITSQHPDIRVLGMSTYSEASIIRQMIQHGAKGYLLKNASADDLVKAIHLVHQGQAYFSPEVQKILADITVRDEPQLTRREKEVLALIAEGATTHQIADQLFVSPLTIETHRRNLMQKFEVNNAPALIRAAIEHKLL